MKPEEKVSQLLREAKKSQKEADLLRGLLAEFPDLEIRTGRWNKVAYVSASVNSKVTDYDVRYNCGCCNDSPREVWPFVETPLGKVYSNPPYFFVGKRDEYIGGCVADIGWDEQLRKAGIPDALIDRIGRGMRSPDEPAPEEESDGP